MIQRFRNWKTVIAVLALLLAAEGAARTPVVQRMVDPVDGSIEAARWRYAAFADETDIVLMGDSRAALDLSPNVIQAELLRLTGDQVQVVNIAVGGSPMEQSALLFSEIVAREGLPQLVVLNISEVALNDAAWHDNPPHYMRGAAAPLSLDTWRIPQSRSAVLDSLSGLMRLHPRLRLAVEGPWIRYWRGSEQYDWGARRWYGQMDAQGQAEQLAAYRDAYLADFNPTGVQMRHLEDILRKARDQNVRLVLLLTPVKPAFLGAFPSPDDVARFTRSVNEVAKRYGVPLIDYYQLPEMGDDKFFDLHHTNVNGAEWLSTLLSREALAQAWQDWDNFAAAHTEALTASHE